MPDGSPRRRRPASAPGWFAAGVVVLLVNTAYLAAFASPTPFYFGNVVLHMLLGLALAVVCARPIDSRLSSSCQSASGLAGRSSERGP